MTGYDVNVLESKSEERRCAKRCRHYGWFRST